MQTRTPAREFGGETTRTTKGAERADEHQELSSVQLEVKGLQPLAAWALTRLLDNQPAGVWEGHLRGIGRDLVKYLQADPDSDPWVALRVRCLQMNPPIDPDTLIAAIRAYRFSPDSPPPSPTDRRAPAPASAARSSARLCLIPASSVASQKVEWLWYPRIPRGCITMMDGDPGTGKSFCSLAIATAVSRGVPLPESPEHLLPSRVLIVNTEDDLSRSLRPRLEAMGADLEKIDFLREVVDEKGNAHLFDLGLDLGALEEYVAEHHPALVIIDPLQAHIGKGVDLNQANETRSALGPLALLAERYGFAVLIVRHVNKASGLKALYRGLGSIDLTGIARSVLVVGEDPDEKGKRGIVQVKSNFGPLASALEFRIEPPHGQFSWKPGPSTLTADRVLGSAANALTPERQGILELAQRKGKPIGAQDVVENLPQISADTARHLLSTMAALGQLVKVGYGKYTAPVHTPQTIHSIHTSPSEKQVEERRAEEREGTMVQQLTADLSDGTRPSLTESMNSMNSVNGMNAVKRGSLGGQNLAPVDPPARRCYACGGTEYRPLPYGGEVCASCHPDPLKLAAEFEKRRSAQSQPRDGPNRKGRS